MSTDPFGSSRAAWFLRCAVGAHVVAVNVCESGSNRLAKKDGYGGLVVFRNCRNLIRTLPAMVYSRTHPEDIDQSCEEHAVDALRYALTRKRGYFAETRVLGI
jgi:hypothetical protein